MCFMNYSQLHHVAMHLYYNKQKYPFLDRDMVTFQQLKRKRNSSIQICSRNRTEKFGIRIRIASKTSTAILERQLKIPGCRTYWQEYGVNFVIRLKFSVRSTTGNRKLRIGNPAERVFALSLIGLYTEITGRIFTKLVIGDIYE
jgi:hypothetical protein